MKILIGCEFSGVVRDAFRAKGHDAWSCDLLPASDGSPHHYQTDVLDIICDPWDMAIFHPPCTFLNSAGLHWIKRGRIEKDGRLRIEHQKESLAFVRKLLDAPIGRIALENPIGCISTYIRRFDQIIHPYEFGDDASKSTCLWLKGLPKLVPTKYIEPRIVSGKKRWSNQTDSGQNHLPPSEDRWKLRSLTYSGIAKAMAVQWG